MMPPRRVIRYLRAFADVHTALAAQRRGVPKQAQMAAFRMALAKAARRRLRRWNAAVR